MTNSMRGEERSSRATIVGILIVMAAIAAGILWVSSPTEELLGESAYRVRSAFHGLFAGIFMVTMTIGLYEAFRLWSGKEIRIRELEIGSVVNAVVCFLTIVFGNWIYIPYRAASGPRTHFLATSPEIHKIFFEFKEFTALFTLPLVVTAAYLIFRYGEKLNFNKPLREMTALVLVLAFFYFVVAFGLGAAITKLKSV
jgi:cytochrome bd-type quinol oxidase subunit 1